MILNFVKMLAEALKSFGISITPLGEGLTDRNKTTYLKRVVGAKGETYEVNKSLLSFLIKCKPFIKNPFLRTNILVIAENKSQWDYIKKMKGFINHLSEFLKEKGIMIEVALKILVSSPSQEVTLKTMSIFKTARGRNWRNYHIKGLYYPLGDKEAVIATHDNSNLYTHQPVKIRIVKGKLPLEKHISYILSFTFLNYSSFKPIKLPATTYHTDKMARMALRGLKPAKTEGEEMFWL